MREPGIVEWLLLLLLLLLSALAWWGFVQCRYLLERLLSRNWPTETATVQKSAITRVSSVRGSWTYGAFFGYSFSIQGVTNSGLFVVVGPEDRLTALQSTLTGATLPIRYKPSAPSVSFVDDLQDPRFQGLNATQDPEWLKQAPLFSVAPGSA